jgi:hypothetical protein
VENDGARGERWAALAGAIDPVENLRVIGEIQRMGLDAAIRLLARFGGEAGSAEGSEDGGSADDDRRPLFGAEPGVDAGPLTDLRNMRAGAERFIDLMAEAAKRFVDAGAGLIAEPDRPAANRVVIATLGGVGTSELTIPSAGSALTVGELRRHDGRTLSNGAVRSQVLGTTAETTRLVLRVDVPPGVEPGTYHGVAVAEGLTDFSIALTVHVAEP